MSYLDAFFNHIFPKISDKFVSELSDWRISLQKHFSLKKLKNSMLQKFESLTILEYEYFEV